MKKKLETLKEWDGKSEIECIHCHSNPSSFGKLPFCSESCANKFDDHAPTRLINELYDKMRSIRENQ